MPDIKVNIRLTKENHDFISKPDVYFYDMDCKSKSMALEKILNKAIEDIRENVKIKKEKS